MKKLTAVIVAILALLIAVPLATVAFVTSGASAVAQATACTTAGPPTGQWRPPFQQAYVVGGRGFGMELHPIYHQWRMHTGQDMTSLPGPGPVVAVARGTVVKVGAAGTAGNLVVLDHGSGLRTKYEHLASIAPKIRPGASVWIGQLLGLEGTTGASTGDHLHFEVLNDGVPIDPIPFMLAHGAPLDGKPVPPSPPPDTDLTETRQPDDDGFIFELPPPGTPRLNSLNSPPLPIPAPIKAHYVAAADRYHLPWTLLAGIGMEETGHGRNTSTSRADAQGLMQFIPATFATYGVDGDGDGRADIRNDADSVMSAANYLTASGVTAGVDGVRRALFAYNHADWYVNDVLFYARAYGVVRVAVDPVACGAAATRTPTWPDGLGKLR